MVLMYAKFFLVAMCIGTQNSVATLQAKKSTTSEMPPEFFRGKPLYKKWGFDWLEQSWKTQGGEPYAAFRKFVDELGTKAEKDTALERKLVGLAVTCRNAAKKMPTAPFLQFRHAYAGYMAVQVSKDSGVWSVVGLNEAIERYKFVKTPSQPEYDRAAFLLDDLPMPHNLRRKVGKRLLSRDPDDRRVAYTLIQVTNPSLSNEEREDAIKLADTFVSKWPDLPKSYAVRGGVYDRSFFHDHRKRQDGFKAIENFSEFLKRSSNDDRWRQTAQEHIAYIRLILKK